MQAPSLSPSPFSPAQPTGLVLFAHGSRDPLWRGPIEAVALQLRAEAPHLKVRCAYLELCEPGLAAACAQLAAEGLKRIAVLPLFLGMGRHARADLPQLVAQISADHPALELVLQPPVGEHPALTRLLARLALEATGGGAPAGATGH